MNKLITLKIGNGSSKLGYSVTLEIAEERWIDDRIWLSNPSECKGDLPPALELLQDYQQWQQTYRYLDTNHRLEADPAQITNISSIDSTLICQNAAQRTIDSFNRWLKAESFHQIREHLAKNISERDRIRFLLQIDDLQLHRLPWQVSDLFATYGATEVVLSSPQLEPIQLIELVPKSDVQILAILGNSQGIDTRSDRKVLENLPNAKVEFLVEPQRMQLTDRLWDRHWDILFFAGHSSSDIDNTSGRIYLNQTDSLSIEELRYGLKKAIANGLKIAIFNSCDGLGLAKSLSDLQIPQVIVMREPVPDRVAQTFLKGFLELYSQGKSFYRSVREARERLQGLEDKFPCATWLPTIYQSGTSYPPNWHQLQGTKNTARHHLKLVLCSSLITTIAIAVIRSLGMLQPLELQAFDLTMRSRPTERQKDSNILIIEIAATDNETQRKQGFSSGSSLSDAALDRLLTKLRPLAPRIIGIDNFLNHSIDPKYTEIHNSLKSGDLVAVCKTAGASKSGELANKSLEAPPPSASKFGFGDTIADSDGVLRRQLLSMDTKSIKPGASCNSDLSLSMMLAYEYLYLDPQQITLRIGDDTMWQQKTANKNVTNSHISSLSYSKHLFLRKVSIADFPKYLTARSGGYQGFDFDDRGYQILVNYRAIDNSLRSAIPAMSLQEVLTLPVDKLQQAVRDKLVLIGTTDDNYGDIAKTPYGNIPGVFFQAQVASQLISAALEGRPLFWVQPFWVDNAIVLFCATTGAVLAWRVRNTWLSIGLFSSILVICYGGAIWLLASYGWWMPLVPSLGGLLITGGCVKIYSIRAAKFSLVNPSFLGSNSR
ncbi:CHASE2 domain-containing protein [Chamaesiphon sp. GL140_3_metabinner_50]|uniref:CHASE2 domain-containing protein n=1 Tax=Chamaesiphon sp. GL140_3_metabinner_50 TaxID=2970812 RepID=UPI0025FF9D3E|nr:CHASE2 domain-containing protein [Chamaesiphon sp. GL140_3_metabinner_50]